MVVGDAIKKSIYGDIMTRIKSFADLIAVWSTNLIGWILGFAMHDLIEVAMFIKEIFDIIAFGVGICYTIHRFRKDKLERSNKK